MIFFVCVLLVFSIDVFSQSFQNKGVRNFLLYPSSISQTEPVVVRHPHNRNTLFVSANTIKFLPFFVSEGVYVSTDAGLNWYGSDTCKGEYINFHGGDPAVAIDKNGTFILTRLGRSPFVGLYVHYSTDFGKTWSFQNAINDHDLERAILASDVFTNSPFYGRTYSVWVRFNPPYALYFSYSDDGGITWSQPRQINNPTQRCAGGDIVIGKNGEVYLTWAVVAASSPFQEQFIGFAKSTDGGATWQVTEKAFAVNGIQGQLPEKQNIRVNGQPKIAIDTIGGERDGWIYIVTTQKNFGAAGRDPDVILYRSTDKGLSWQGPIRVNQDQLNNGKIQYFPALTIDQYGAINILYYDDRNTTSDSTGVFLSRSTDGGNSFVDYQISDHNFKPEAIGGLGQGYQGDLIALTSIDNYLIPIWMDNSTGNYQLWTARVNINQLLDVERETQTKMIKNFYLAQNFPNPFNSQTNIEFEIPEDDFVRLEIFNLLGQKIKTLVNDYLKKGHYQTVFNADKLPSGIYIYKLQSSSKELIKKMIYLK
ncbi:MAG: T9SS type A sorting domain-containing protein [Ignavibacteria bacterium]